MKTDAGNQSNPLLYIRLRNNKTLPISFDTGDNVFIRFSNELIDELSVSAVYELMSAGYGASSIGGYGSKKQADKIRIKFPLLTINNIQFTNVITETDKGVMPGIGTKLLEYGNVTLDFLSGNFYFDSRAERYDLKEKRWSCQPAYVNEKLVVGSVWDKAPNSLKPSLPIIAIDGKDFSHVSFCDLINNKPILYGKDKATLTIRNEQGEQEQVIISKE